MPHRLHWIAIAALLVAGFSAQVDARRSRKGRFRVRVQTSASGQVMPRNTRWVRIQVIRPPERAPVRVRQVRATASTGATVRFPKLAPGPVLVRVEAFATPFPGPSMSPSAPRPNTAHEPVAIAEGRASGEIRPGQTTTLEFSLESTIARVAVTPVDPTILGREVVPFVATGYNALDQAVPGAHFNWSVGNANVAELVNGLSAANDGSEQQGVKGIGAGQTNVSAQEDFGLLTGSSLLTVLYVSIDPNTPGPHLQSPNPPIIEEMAPGLVAGDLPAKPACGTILPPSPIRDLDVTTDTVLPPGLHRYRNISVAPGASLRSPGALRLTATGFVDIAGDVWTRNGPNGGDLVIECEGNLSIRGAGSVFTVADKNGDASGDVRLCSHSDMLLLNSGFGFIFTDDGNVSTGNVFLAAPNGTLRIRSTTGLSIFSGHGPVGGDVILVGKSLDARDSVELFIGTGMNPGQVLLFGCDDLEFTNSAPSFTFNGIFTGGPGYIHLLSGGPLKLSNLEIINGSPTGFSLGVCLEGRGGVKLGPQTRVGTQNSNLKVIGFLPTSGVGIDMSLLTPPPIPIRPVRAPSTDPSLIVADSGDLVLATQLLGQGKAQATTPASSAARLKPKVGGRRRRISARQLYKYVARRLNDTFLQAADLTR